MTTNFQEIDTPGVGQSHWEGVDMTSPNSEALLSYDSLPAIFFIDPYSNVSIEIVNKHATADLTVKLFVSNFDDPGSTFSTDFTSDSKWAQVRDADGTVVSITVTADGTPANNQTVHIDGRYKWLAVSASNGAGDYTNSIDMAVTMTKRDNK